MDAVAGLPVAIETHSDAGAGTGRGRVSRWEAPPPPHRPRPAAQAPPRSPAHQRGDDDAPGGAAAVGVQVLLALAPPAAQPEGVEEQEQEIQGEAGQRGGPEQQQRLRGGRGALEVGLPALRWDQPGRPALGAREPPPPGQCLWSPRSGSPAASWAQVPRQGV